MSLHFGAEAPALGLAEAEALSAVAARLAGVRIPPSKKDFLRQRAAKRLRALRLDDFKSYVRILSEDADEQRRLMECLTTHTTAFFREPAHFDWLRDDGAPGLIDAGVGRGGPLTIWSAACSTGAELWSAAMCLDEVARQRAPALDWRVVGTDVSHTVLRRAATAVFAASEIEGVPEALRKRHLLRSKRPIRGATLYRIAPELRARGRYACANLMRLDQAAGFSVDIAFLRNVLIYFSTADQRAVVENVLRRVRPGGFLLTGHSENLALDGLGLRRVRPSIYQREWER